MDASVAEILGYIVAKAREAKQLKEECFRLGNFSVVLLAALNQNEKVLQDVESAGALRVLLHELLEFVLFCQREWTVFQKAWEVMWKKRLPRMTKQMLDYLILCTFESTVTARSDLQSFQQGLDKMKMNILDIKETQSERKAAMENIVKLIEELEQIRSERPSSTAVPIEFPDGDPRLRFTGEHTTRKHFGTLIRGSQLEDVVCVAVDPQDMKPGQQGPRYVDIYSRITAMTLVQPFYGIGIENQQHFAVMKDLRKLPTLTSFTASNQFPTDMLSRLRFAYNIACMIASLHEAQILVKNLADNNIVFTKQGQDYKPVICELEQARLFLEPTTSIAYDVRYEAPEYAKMVTHSKYTDIWSLGIILWQCTTAGKPFDQADPIDPTSEAASVLRSTLNSNSLARILSSPAQSKDSNLPSSVMELIRSCCNFQPTRRPPAAQVAQSIFNIWVRQSVDMPQAKVDQVETTNDIEAKVWDIISRKRKDKHVVVQIEADDISAMESSISQGDAVSAFLFGALIFYDVVDESKFDSLDDAGIETESTGEERRARSALTHLEFSIAAGVTEATREAAAAHHILAKLYAEKYRQS